MQDRRRRGVERGGRDGGGPAGAPDRDAWVALTALPSSERDPITLALFGGLTYRQVALLLGLPEDTVKRQIRVGLLRLGATLLERATTSTASTVVGADRSPPRP